MPTLFGVERMKVLECHLCGSLFRSNEQHITVYGGNGAKDNINYCTRCSTFVFMYGIEGLDKILDVIKDAEHTDNGN